MSKYDCFVIMLGTNRRNPTILESVGPVDKIESLIRNEIFDAHLAKKPYISFRDGSVFWLDDFIDPETKGLNLYRRMRIIPKWHYDLCTKYKTAVDNKKQ